VKMKNDGLKKITTIVALIGLIDAVYLTIEKITQNRAMCLPGLGDCWTVSNSQYSQVFGIPVSALGIVTYLIILLLLFIENRYTARKEIILQITLGITLSGIIYSIYLTYLEIAVIKAVCPFCVISAIAMSILFVCAILRLIKNQSEFKTQLEGKNG